MRIVWLAALIALVGGFSAASAHPVFPPGAEAREQSLLAQVNPSQRAWIVREARRSADGQVGDLTGEVKSGYPGGGDIEALCFLVLMEATRDMDSDLQTIMAEVKAQTNAKQALRRQMRAINTD